MLAIRKTPHYGMYAGGAVAVVIVALIGMTGASQLQPLMNMDRFLPSDSNLTDSSYTKAKKAVSEDKAQEQPASGTTTASSNKLAYGSLGPQTVVQPSNSAWTNQQAPAVQSSATASSPQQSPAADTPAQTTENPQPSDASSEQPSDPEPSLLDSVLDPVVDTVDTIL